MQLDNQGRALLRLPTTMRLAFEGAFNVPRRPIMPPHPAAQLIHDAIRSNHGYRKVPAWTVTRKGKR